MREVLFIAYYYPPMAGAGVQKSLKFVKYLQEFDYHPIVLTVNPRYARWIKDKSLLSEVPQSTVVYRTPTIDLNWLFKALWGFRLNKVVTWLQHNWLLPDPEKTWLPFARRQIDKIVKRHNIDLVYITGGPFSTMLLGPYCFEKHHLKYVVDFRDEWTSNPTRLDASFPRRSQAIDNQYEATVIKYASGVVYTIPLLMKENFEQKYPLLLKKPTRIITNGFDEPDFAGLVKTHVNIDKLRIVYTGSFYDRRQPGILWEAIKQLIHENKLEQNKISIEIIGRNTPSFVLGDYIADASISQIVKFTSNKQHKDSLASLVNADALLLYIAQGPNCKAEMTGKLFEYIRSNTPILAIIPPDGIAAEIIRNSKTGFIYDSAEVDAVKGGILEIYKLWESGQLKLNPDMEYMNRFSRKALTGQLARLFDEVLQNQTSTDKSL